MQTCAQTLQQWSASQNTLTKQEKWPQRKLFSCYCPASLLSSLHLLFFTISVSLPLSRHSWIVTRRDRLFRSCIKGTNYTNMQPTSILSIRPLSKILPSFRSSSALHQPLILLPSSSFSISQTMINVGLFLFPPSPSAFLRRTSSFPPTFPSSFYHINLDVEHDATRCLAVLKVALAQEISQHTSTDPTREVTGA